jgi:hypothetical protein
MLGHFESESGIQQNARRKGIYAIARRENCIWIDTCKYIYNIGLMFGRGESESCIWQKACYEGINAIAYSTVLNQAC